MYFGSIDNIHGVRDAYQRCFPLWEDQWDSPNVDVIMNKIKPSNWIQTV